MIAASGKAAAGRAQGWALALASLASFMVVLDMLVSEIRFGVVSESVPDGPAWAVRGVLPGHLRPRRAGPRPGNLRLVTLGPR